MTQEEPVPPSITVETPPQAPIEVSSDFSATGNDERVPVVYKQVTTMYRCYRPLHPLLTTQILMMDIIQILS